MDYKIKNFLLMAIAAGNKSTEATEAVKRYIGVAPVTVIGVNPTKEEIKSLMGYEPKEEPVYFGVQDDGNGNKVNYARIDFIVKTDVDKTDIECVGRMSYFLRNQYRKGSQSGKYQVVDKYNNSAWATEETIKSKAQVMYSNGPAKIIGDYRPAYIGEWELMNFIRQYLCIGSSGETNGFDYINGSWVQKKPEELVDCECSFTIEEIQKMFKGDFSPVKNAIALQPTNKVKVLFGVREVEGKEYQDIFTGCVLRSNATNLSKLQDKIEETKANGGLSDRVYDFCDLKEYVVAATDFNKVEQQTTDPFATAATDSPW